MRTLGLLPLLGILVGSLACSAAPQATPAPQPAQTAAPAPSIGGEPTQTAPVEPEQMPTVPAAGEIPRNGPADIRGKVTQFHRALYGEPPVGTILVEGPRAEDTKYERANIRVTRETRIVRAGGEVRMPFNQLKTGSLVEVTFTGPVAESDPVQATAEVIVFLGSEPVQQ